MEAIIDFLLEYYWVVLGVLIILLITVVGFLADIKRKKKLREKTEKESISSSANNNFNNNYQDFNNMNQNMNMGVNDFNNNFNNNFNTPNGSEFNISPNLNNNMVNPNVNQNFQQPVNNFDQNMDYNMNQNVNQVLEPRLNNFNHNQGVNVNDLNNSNSMENNINGSNDNFFIPASDQKPQIEPREVVVPKPVEPAHIINNNNQGPLGVGNSTQVINSAEGLFAVNTPSPSPIPVVETPAVTSVVQPSEGIQNNIGPVPTNVNNFNIPVSPAVTPAQQPSYNEPYQNNISNQNMGVQSMSVDNINQVSPGVGPAVQPSMPSMQNLNQPVMPNNQNMPNNNFLSGGSTFVVGTPQQTMNNQIPNNGDNWKL